MSRKRGVYAPTRALPDGIDAFEMLRASEAARADERRVTEQAQEAARAFSQPADPVSQILQRLHAAEERIRALEDATYVDRIRT